MAQVFIGCSGFSYKHWRGSFYPEELPQKQWLHHYCSVFSTVELNVTFYRLPKGETFAAWRRETPVGFSFAIKGSRFITHIKRLGDVKEPLERFFDAALKLEEKLRVVLWQLPPSFGMDAERFGRFVEMLKPYGLRHTFEFRNESWLDESIVRLCREQSISFCMADHPEFLRRTPPTADFVYIRRHGYDQSYTGSYSSDELRADARVIRERMEEGKDVYIYFNNDIGGHAPRNAVELKGMLE